MSSHSDAELSTLDLAALLQQGITDGEGRMREDLQGIGSVAAAIQLDNQFVTAQQVNEAASGHGGFVAPPLQQLISLGEANAADDADRELFKRWLGMVAAQLVLRERARAS
jgi:hypothetical protein